MTDPSAGTPDPHQPDPHQPDPHQPAAAHPEPPVRPIAAPRGYQLPTYPMDRDPAALPPPPDPRLVPHPHPGWRPPPPPRPYDPLVAYDFSSWMDRVQGVLKRSWRGMLKALVLGQLVPLMLAYLVLGGILVALVLLVLDNTDGDASVWSVIAILAPGYVLLMALGSYLAAVSGRAVMKVATNDAVGQPVAPGEALQWSWRSAGPTAGWLLLGIVGTVIGIYLCYLPGLYVSVAASLITPVMAFERREGLARSFRLVHSHFWPAAGRILAVTAAVGVLMSLVMTIVYAVVIAVGLMLLSGGDPLVGVIGATVLGIILFAVITAMSVLGSVAIYAGYLVTYAELRGRLQPGLTARQLAAEVNA